MLLLLNERTDLETIHLIERYTETNKKVVEVVWC